MQQHEADQLAKFMRAHNRQCGLVNIASIRTATRSRVWTVEAYEIVTTDEGKQHARVTFDGRDAFTASKHYDATAPLRMDSRIADHQEAIALQQFNSKVGEVVARLRSLADAVEAHGHDLDEGERNTADVIARRIIHDLMWAVPNMSIEDLPRMAQTLIDNRATARTACDALLAAEQQPTITT